MHETIALSLIIIHQTQSTKSKSLYRSYLSRRQDIPIMMQPSRPSTSNSSTTPPSTTTDAYGVIIHRRSSFADLSAREKKHTISRRTSFSTIAVREYNQTIGDSPSCQEGAPISLGWTYHENTSVSLDEYENERIPQRRRRRSELVMGITERRQKLVGNGLSVLEVMRAERMNALKNNALPSLKKNIQRMKLNHEAGVKRAVPPKKSMVSRAA